MPISDCEVRDPRIRRTRQLLQTALRDLMQSKSLDEISVQDITGAATLNRATFYDHYTDKFALFGAMVAGGFHKLLTERNVTFQSICPVALGDVILAVCDYLGQTHSKAADCARQGAFEPLLEAAIIASLRGLLLPGIQARPSGSRSSVSPEIVAGAVSWAIYGAVREWFRSADRLPAGRIVAQIVPLILPLLGVAASSA